MSAARAPKKTAKPKAADVDAYLEAVTAERRPVLTELRRACRRHLVGYEEAIEYGMPSYRRNGVVEVAFASQKSYIALYILKQDVLQAHAASLRGLSVGKGCIRYTKPDRVDFDVVRKLLEGTFASTERVC